MINVNKWSKVCNNICIYAGQVFSTLHNKDVAQCTAAELNNPFSVTCPRIILWELCTNPSS